MMTPEREHQEYPPLLFTVQQSNIDGGPPLVPEYRSPRHSTPRRGSESVVTPSRRSLTPPGIAMDTTPVLPPVARLYDSTPMSVEPRYTSRGFGSSPEPRTPAHDDAPAVPTTALVPTQPPPATPGHSALYPIEQVHSYDDSWVTVFGFTPDDITTVLNMVHACGDILTYGTFGAPTRTNYVHVQFQNKYGAQKCLMRNGEELVPGLIIGVRPLTSEHRRAIQEHSADGSSSPAMLLRPQAAMVRPYTVDAAKANALPTPSKSFLAKFNEYILGV